MYFTAILSHIQIMFPKKCMLSQKEQIWKYEIITLILEISFTYRSSYAGEKTFMYTIAYIKDYDLI